MCSLKTERKLHRKTQIGFSIAWIKSFNFIGTYNIFPIWLSLLLLESQALVHKFNLTNIRHSKNVVLSYKTTTLTNFKLMTYYWIKILLSSIQMYTSPIPRLWYFTFVNQYWRIDAKRKFHPQFLQQPTTIVYA